jgi:Fe2+ or Zn2+ uptake regulation protein
MTAGTVDAVLIDKLRERGRRVTSQRLVIHRVLRERDRHLTAEQVLQEVCESLPGISLPTVYATLELLEELGLVRRRATGGGPLLFDPRTSPHAHAVCRDCGTISDVEFPEASARALGAAAGPDFRADHAELVVWGRCGACAAAAG